MYLFKTPPCLEGYKIRWSHRAEQTPGAGYQQGIRALCDTTMGRFPELCVLGHTFRKVEQGVHRQNSDKRSSFDRVSNMHRE